jgi:coatomer protein complex subunit gamma
MVYLAIKELATTAEDVIMVTSSIMKDMQPNSEVIYRPNAIRALCRIIDVRLPKLWSPMRLSLYSLPWLKV